MMTNNRARQSKRKIIVGLLIGVLAIVLFGFAIHLIEKHGLLDEQFGDTGDWGDSSNIELYLDDREFVSDDSVRVYMLAGTDAGGEDWGEGLNGDMADFIALLVIDNTTEKYGFYQIDRNSMLEIEIPDADGNYNGSFYNEQICTAHWYGKTYEERHQKLADAVADLMGGLDCDGYYVVNMKDIGRINDAIGGVDVTVQTDMTDIDPAFTEGATVHLTGDQAEKYVRSRMSLKDDTNASRMDRHTQYMQGSYDAVMAQLREDPNYINALNSELNDIIDTDTGNKALSVIAKSLLEYENAGILRFTGDTKTNDTFGDGKSHEEFYMDQKSVIELLGKVIDLKETDGDE